MSVLTKSSVTDFNLKKTSLLKILMKKKKYNHEGEKNTDVVSNFRP